MENGTVQPLRYFGQLPATSTPPQLFNSCTLSMGTL